MTTPAHIRHDQQELLDSLVSGKLPRNLAWSAVVDLIGQIGEIKPHGNDEFAFVVGGQREVFRRSAAHNLEVDDIARLRRFLRDAELPNQPAPQQPSERTVVVLDHHVAHIFHDTGGSRPEGEAAVRPYDPFGFQPT